MQIVRTIVWVLLLFSLLAFSFFNWKPVEVQIWSNLVLETKLPALVIISFLLGLVPMWLLHRASTWRANRRIAALETATQKMSAPAPSSSAPIAPDPVVPTATTPEPATPTAVEPTPVTPAPAPSPGEPVSPVSPAQPDHPIDPAPKKPE